MCKFHFSIARAKINPPRYKNIYLWPYDDDVSSIDNAPERGKSIIGNNEVAAIGIASVIHHAATQRVEANIALASCDMPSKDKKYRTSTKSNGPKKRPIFLEFNF